MFKVISRFYDRKLDRIFEIGETYPTDKVSEFWVKYLSTNTNRLRSPVIEEVKTKSKKLPTE